MLSTALPRGSLCWYRISVYIDLNRLINSIVIGWMSLTRIASLDASPPFILLQSTDEMKLCLLLKLHNRLCYCFDRVVTNLTSIEHMFQLLSGPFTARSYLNTFISLPAFFSPLIA
jgi:hypothetical protein